MIPKIGIALCAIALLALTGCPDGAPPPPLDTTPPPLDTTSPMITLTGEREIRVVMGDSFDDPGATVADNDLNYPTTMAIPTIRDSGGTEVLADALTDTAGTYTITYNAPPDAASNSPTAVMRTVTVVPVIDGDNDRLIDINTLEELNAMRYNLDGTSYRTSAGGTEFLCGTDAATACIGYELLRDLDFADGTSYASGTVNLDWRPTGGGTAIVATDSATNAGWEPIGTSVSPFSAFSAHFSGNDFAISNLYVRGTTRVGLFGRNTGTIQDIGVVDANIYGGTGNDHVGGLVGLNTGTITASYSIGGGVDGGDGGTDSIGSLIGRNNGTVTASYATGDVDGGGVDGGDGHNDPIGGLVGQNFGTITASYATGDVDGGAGSSNRVGGLVGRNFRGGTITASYATGNIDGGDDGDNNVGGLIGRNVGTVTASYATGNVDGGAGDSDSAGGLVGDNIDGAITASYATGDVDGGAGTFDDAGGLVGVNFGTITANYATGDVDGGGGGSDDAGGLVGFNNGAITASYATGDASGVAGGDDRTGALVSNGNSNTTASYGFGTATGEEDAAGATRSLDATDSSSDTPPGTVDDACDITEANSSTMTGMTGMPDSRWDTAQWDFGTGTAERPFVRHNGTLVPGQPTDRNC